MYQHGRTLRYRTCTYAHVYHCEYIYIIYIYIIDGLDLYYLKYIAIVLDK